MRAITMFGFFGAVRLGCTQGPSGTFQQEA